LFISAHATKNIVNSSHEKYPITYKYTSKMLTEHAEVVGSDQMRIAEMTFLKH